MSANHPIGLQIRSDMVPLRHWTRKSLCKKFDYKCAANSASDAFDCDQIATRELTEPHMLFAPEARVHQMLAALRLVRQPDRLGS